jgi:alkylation response protein AidB-like acyl-CoA dehydrogenase
MNFDLTEEQKILKGAAHSFLAKEYPKEVVRRLKESPEGYSPSSWRKMADLGWMGVIFPEEYGGSGGSLPDLIVLLEEMGYAACPSPFLPTVVLGGLPILMAGSDEQRRELLPKIASGDLLMTLALTEPDVRDPTLIPRVNAFLNGGEYVVEATKLFVPDARAAGRLLCVARTERSQDAQTGITIFLIDAGSPGIRLTPLENLAKDKQFEVIFDRVCVPAENILGGAGQGGGVLKEILDWAAVAKAAEMIGGAQAAMDMALQYAKERVQFDRPIGSFQAVQRHFVDMWMDIYGGRYLVYKAASKISEGRPASLDAAMAKAHVGRAFRRVTTLAHQVFGAISFTMEHDLHFYYRQALAGDLAWGNSDYQRGRLAEELGL